MSEPPQALGKQQVATALLEQASVFVHLDPRCDGVTAPPWFKRQPQLVLQIGFRMAVRIPDLVVDDAGIRCTLSFNRSPHWCCVPWAAVYALVGEKGESMVWPDDVPPELATAGARPRLQVVDGGRRRRAAAQRQAAAEAGAGEGPIGGGPTDPHRQLAPPVDDAPGPDADPTEPTGDAGGGAAGERPRRPPWLRVVK